MIQHSIDSKNTQQEYLTINYCLSGQVLFVCPGFLHRVHECFLFRVSDSVPLFEAFRLGVTLFNSEAVETGADDCLLEEGTDGCIDEADDFEEEGFGAEGSGHVMSAARVDLQCILMFSYKYHCLVRSNPGMVVFSGMDVCRSDVDTSGFSKSISTASVSENVCARIFPGLLDDVRKQW